MSDADAVIEAMDAAIYEASGLSMPRSIRIRRAVLRAAEEMGWKMVPNHCGPPCSPPLPTLGGDDAGD